MNTIKLHDTDVITELEMGTPTETFVRVVIDYNILPEELKQEISMEEYIDNINEFNLSDTKIYLACSDYSSIDLYDIESNAYKGISSADDYKMIFVRHLKPSLHLL